MWRRKSEPGGEHAIDSCGAMPVVTRQRPGMAAPPDSITQIALASPLCAQASNPGALVSLSMNHLTPRGTGGGQACPYRETAIARKNPPRRRKAARHEDPHQTCPKRRQPGHARLRPRRNQSKRRCARPPRKDRTAGPSAEAGPFAQAPTPSPLEER